MTFGSRIFTYHLANLAVWLFMLLSASVFLASAMAGRAWPLEGGLEVTCERLAKPAPYKLDQSGGVRCRRLSLHCCSECK